MTADVHIFLGPSLPLSQAQEILEARYHPPATAGDVCELVLDRDPPFAVGIVDGLFEQVPAVWHKEILYAITRGVLVFGAASMGALRAAELHRFGMIGVGEVFAAYRDGACEDDDEVAVVHGPAEHGHRPLSTAMVTIRAGLRAAVTAGVLGAPAAWELTELAKRTFYAERSWDAVYAAGRANKVPEAEIAALRDFVRDYRPDVKRADAVAMLHRIRDAVERGERPTPPPFELEPTYYWEKMCRTVRNDRAARRDPGGASDPDGLLRYLVDREATRLGLLHDAGDQARDDSFESARRVLEERYRREFGRLAAANRESTTERVKDPP